MYLIFDTETTGLPLRKDAPLSDLDNWPRLVQLAWQLHGHSGQLVESGNFIIKPVGFTIPFNAEKVHGISTKKANEVGKPIIEIIDLFLKALNQTKVLVGHNLQFDNKIIGAELYRLGISNFLEALPVLDTSVETVQWAALPGGPGGKFKSPKLTELHSLLFGQPFSDAHDAAYDVDATARCFFELLKRKVMVPIEPIDLSKIEYVSPDLSKSNFVLEKEKKTLDPRINETSKEEINAPFFHLHVHSQFSVLQATPSVERLVKKAKEMGMPAIGLTDLGNMFGAFKFVKSAIAAGIKPIVGCEFFVSEERKKNQFTLANPDKRFQQVLLAKNKKGYENLIKLCSLGYTEGLYGLYPRIDKQLIVQYKESIIALSGGLNGEIAQLILNVGETQAEEALVWWKDQFGDDFYIELNHHGLEEEEHLQTILVKMAIKHNIKIIAANELFYIDRSESTAHDVLICIKENEKQSTPIGRGRGFRPGLKNDQYYFRSADEMKSLFRHLPESIINLSEIFDKVESYKLDHGVLLPKFSIPDEFKKSEDEIDGGKRGENAYLRHLAYAGAAKKYDLITDQIKERLDFELATIEKTGYPGYFLIVQDFTSKAREMGVSVGPGRGSAAGSVVAYCIGITNVDPIAYNLLFERFLNPDRVSLPDIDIDFDDEGRDKVIQYVVEKYGYSQVAQIITYGTMAPKSAIRDAGRVMELPLSETDAIAKLVPERPGAKFEKVLDEIPQLSQILKGQDLASQVLNQAVVLEGSLRNTGIHACGVIIAPKDISDIVPVAKSKDSELLLTQFDNSVVESAGLLKMDFLGLKTLSVIKTTLENIRKRRGLNLDIDRIALNDEKTFQLYQKGETNGTFQFESNGMQKHLRNLKPDCLEDLIAMNALYRPGPMDYIPEFIDRKHGRKPIVYDLPEMETFLSETYGITVYQEQVMLLSQLLAGFTKGEADVLRKAMGKKQRDVLDKMKPKFLDQAQSKNHPIEKLEKIWKDWESFAEYAFNKSHSTCYSVVAYQTGYLKANFPAEFMAATLTHNQNNIEKIGFFMEECKNMGIKVLGPHINESEQNFTVNTSGEIRFGLGAIKGTGESAIQSIIEERANKGNFQDIFDFACRVNLRSVNKKSFEALAKSGAFDCFVEFHRRQYVEPDQEDKSLIEKAIQYANKWQNDQVASQVSLFGTTASIAMIKPRVGKIEPYGELEKLSIEKEMVGLYISGHPLDQYSFEMKHLMKGRIADIKEIKSTQKGQDFRIGGIISSAKHKVSKKGSPYGEFTFEDYNDSITFTLFSENYIKFKALLETGWFVCIHGIIAPKWSNSEDLEFKINQMEHLGDIKEKMATGLEIYVPAHHVSENWVLEFTDVITKYPGKNKLLIKLTGFTDQNPIQVDMLARASGISPNAQLIKDLERFTDIKYKILLN